MTARQTLTRSLFLLALLGSVLVSCATSIKPPQLVGLRVAGGSLTGNSLFTVLELSLSNPNKRHLDFNVAELRLFKKVAQEKEQREKTVRVLMNAQLGQLWEPVSISLPGRQVNAVTVKFHFEKRAVLQTAGSFLQQTLNRVLEKFGRLGAAPQETTKTTLEVVAQGLVTAEFLGKKHKFPIKKEFPLLIP